MSTKASRGTKRTCQSNECGARFYDLMREPIACPICGTLYVIASSPTAVAAMIAEEKAAARKAAKKVDFPVVKEVADEAAPLAEGEEALADIEDAEEIPAEEDETFLEEEEEEGGDVSGIIGGPVEGGEEV